MKKIVMLILACFTLSGWADTKKQQGELLYKYACSTCHAPKKAKGIGAPPAFNKAAWDKRLIKAKKVVAETHRFKTVDDYFLYNIQLGKGLMHHGGLCKESQLKHKELVCDEEGYLSAIQYMRGEGR